MKLNLIPVTSLGKRETMAFVDGHDKNGEPWGDYRAVKVDEYPPSPCGEALRHIRVMAGFGLGEASRLLEIRPVELSALERGSMMLSPKQWIEVYQLLRDRWKP